MNEPTTHNGGGLKGTVLEIMRMSTEDGPGIRTTVFLKGCSLKCHWCHNPESISRNPQVQWIGSRCIGCRTCLDVCPEGALSMDEYGLHINRDVCKGCGTCADECPSTALELMGRECNVNDLTAELAKDRAYFEQSGGGVTISGGEPSMQSAFAGALLEACRNIGLHTALDTCGQSMTADLLALAAKADMVLFDIKEIDSVKHKRFTGSDNSNILHNLQALAEQMRQTGKPARLWIRTPIIPKATATTQNISGIGRFIAGHLNGLVDRWELCAFNNLCVDKYTRLGLSWACSDLKLLSAEKMEHLADAARSSGVAPDIVHWSGATKQTEEVKAPDQPKDHLRLVNPACQA